VLIPSNVGSRPVTIVKKLLITADEARLGAPQAHRWPKPLNEPHDDSMRYPGLGRFVGALRYLQRIAANEEDLQAWEDSCRRHKTAKETADNGHCGSDWGLKGPKKFEQPGEEQCDREIEQHWER